VFMPVVVMCLVASPDECQVFRGYIAEDEEACMIEMMTVGLPTLTDMYQDAYIAGVTCMEVDILDQAADAQ
jgi:hypothetical protein